MLGTHTKRVSVYLRVRLSVYRSMMSLNCSVNIFRLVQIPASDRLRDHAWLSHLLSALYRHYCVFSTWMTPLQLPITSTLLCKATDFLAYALHSRPDEDADLV
jgi:hypothetical protein